MPRYLLNFLKFLLFLGIGVVILYLLYRHQNAAFQAECALKGIPGEECSLIDKVLHDFGTVRVGWLLLVLIAFITSNVSRAIRWNMLIRPLGYTPRLINSFFCIMIGYFANLGLPRLGEVLRAGTMAQYEKIPVEKVMGTVVVDRVIDVISILLVTALSIALEYKTIMAFAEQHVSVADKLALLQSMLIWGIPLMLLGFGGLWYFRKPLLATSIGQKIAGLAQGFWQGIQTVRQLDRPWLFVFHSFLIWFMYYSMTWLNFHAFAPTAHLSMIAALITFVFGGWGIVIPSPGGMGTYHFLAQTALAMYGISGEDGFSWANISFFTIQLGGNVAIGLASWMLMPVVNRNYHPQNLSHEHAGAN